PDSSSASLPTPSLAATQPAPRQVALAITTPPPSPEPPPVPRPNPAPQSPPQQPAQQSIRGTNAPGGGPPGPNQPAADPAPQSDSESDPFARVASIRFSGGRLDARLGRAFKSVKPRINLAGELDILSIRSPIVVLKVSIDQNGTVTDVVILRSSGS